MNTSELVETLLRVLVAWNDGRRRVSTDVTILRTAFPRFAGVPIDELPVPCPNSDESRLYRLSGRGKAQ
jgi:hypothetical protein